jgi:hypothetical protein
MPHSLTENNRTDLAHSQKGIVPMLYNPSWKLEIKSDPFSLESLIAWLEKQPGERFYDFYDVHNCMLGQWVRSVDKKARSMDSVTDSATYNVRGREVNLRPLYDIANGGKQFDTFGAALKRARAARG